MDAVIQGATAGFIAAVLTAGLFGSGRCVSNWLGRRREAKLLSSIIRDAERTIFDTEDKFFAVINAKVPADRLRAETYNRMLRKLGACLENRITFLGAAQIAELYDALDWHHTHGLHVTKDSEGQPQFPHFPKGQWPPGATMTLDIAKYHFNRLHALSWLSLNDG